MQSAVRASIHFSLIVKSHQNPFLEPTSSKQTELKISGHNIIPIKCSFTS